MTAKKADRYGEQVKPDADEKRDQRVAYWHFSATALTMPDI